MKALPLLLLLAACATPALPRVSENGRFLVEPDGTPFFWLGDTAWRLFYETTRAEADQYLTDRASKEFSVVYATAFNLGFNSRNEYGQSTFLNGNITQPNDSFFQHVDYIVQKAEDLGLYVAFLPAWAESISYPNGRLFDTATAHAYGNYLATRYKDQSNIVWVLGGDGPGDDGTGEAAAIYRAMAAGLEAGDAGRHLVTFHPNGNPASTSTWFQNDAWLDFHMVESGHTPNSTLAYDLITADYNRTSPTVRPVIDFENNYENIPAGLNPNNPPMTAYDVRKKNYWSLFAGAFGATYGNWEIYEFNDRYSTRYPFKKTWQEALDYPGAFQMTHLRRLMESRPYLSRVPDQSLLTTAAFSGADRIQATRASDGAYAMVYATTGRSFSINLTKLAGPTVDAWWFNPRDGTATYLARYNTTSASQQFVPPTTGTDWILVLDQVSKNFGSPGVPAASPDTAAGGATATSPTVVAPEPTPDSPAVAPPTGNDPSSPAEPAPAPPQPPAPVAPPPIVSQPTPVTPTPTPAPKPPAPTPQPKPAPTSPAPAVSKPAPPKAPPATAKPVTPPTKPAAPVLTKPGTPVVVVKPTAPTKPAPATKPVVSPAKPALKPTVAAKPTAAPVPKSPPVPAAKPKPTQFAAATPKPVSTTPKLPPTPVKPPTFSLTPVKRPTDAPALLKSVSSVFNLPPTPKRAGR